MEAREEAKRLSRELCHMPRPTFIRLHGQHQPGVCMTDLCLLVDAQHEQ